MGKERRSEREKGGGRDKERNGEREGERHHDREKQIQREGELQQSFFIPTFIISPCVLRLILSCLVTTDLVDVHISPPLYVVMLLGSHHPHPMNLSSPEMTCSVFKTLI